MPKLLAMIKELADIDDKYHDLYEPAGDGVDGFVLVGVDDKDFKRRLGEFRDNNTALTKKREELEASLKSFEGIDPDKVRTIQKELDGFKDKTLLDEGKIDELLEQRVTRMRQDHEAHVKALTDERDKATTNGIAFRNQLSETKISSAVQSAISAVAVAQKGAMPDIIERAHKVWSMEDDGTLIAKEGGEPIYGKKADKPLTMEEYAERIVGEAPHLFEDTAGGGAQGSGKGGHLGLGGQKVIPAGDSKSFLANLEKVAKGDVRVEDSSG